MCINVLVHIYTSAYFDMGLLMKALEITWAKPMYMQYIFPCGGGMYLLIAGFESIGYVHGEAALRELSFDFEFVIVVFPVHTQLTIFMSLLLAV